MRKVSLAIALAALFTLPLPAVAAEQQSGAVNTPARRVVAQRRFDVVPIQQQRRRVVARRGYSTPHYWQRYRGQYWGPYYQPWPSAGQYPWTYRPHLGWGPPPYGANLSYYRY